MAKSKLRLDSQGRALPPIMYVEKRNEGFFYSKDQ